MNAWNVDLGWDASLNKCVDGHRRNARRHAFTAVSRTRARPRRQIGYTVEATRTHHSRAPRPKAAHVHTVSGGRTHDFDLTIANTSFVGATVTFTVDATIGGANLALGFLRTDGASMGNSASAIHYPQFRFFPYRRLDLWKKRRL